MAQFFSEGESPTLKHLHQNYFCFFNYSMQMKDFRYFVGMATGLGLISSKDICKRKMSCVSFTLTDQNPHPTHSLGE